MCGVCCVKGLVWCCVCVQVFLHVYSSFIKNKRRKKKTTDGQEFCDQEIILGRFLFYFYFNFIFSFAGGWFCFCVQHSGPRLYRSTTHLSDTYSSLYHV